MTWWPRLSRKEQIEHQLDSELHFHLEQQVAEYIRAGMNEQDASRRARLEFGGLDQVKEECRDTRGMQWVETLIQDLRFALRTLAKSRGFTVAAVATLAVAIGANAAIFGVLEAVLLRPLPYRDAQRLYMLFKSVPARSIEWDWTSAPTVRDWRDQNHAFEDLAIILRPEASLVTWSTEEGPEKIQGSKVFGNFFELLGVLPMLGRTFSGEESRRGGNLAVLSYGFWKRGFGEDPNILGRRLQLDDRSVIIIGVMPPAFQFPDKTTQLWLPLADDARWPLWQQERFRIADAFSALGRLKPGVSLEQARADLIAISERLALEHPSTDSGVGVRVVPVFEHVVGAQVSQTLWILWGAVTCVLLIACSNIAGLLVARGLAQRKELAIRTALGAGRGRLLGQLATQNLLLFAIAGPVGLGVARWGLPVLLAMAPADLPRVDGVGLNWTVAAFTFGLGALAAVIFGLLPAFQIVGRDAHADLHDSSRGTSDAPGARRWRQSLVVSQFALAVMLLACAGLLLRSLLLLGLVNRGFDATLLLTVRIQLPNAKYNSEDHIRAFSEEAVQKINALPGVREASVGSAEIGIFSGNSPNEHILTEDRPLTPDPQRHHRDLVSDNYFRVMRIPLLQGRSFSAADIHGGPPVAVINATMARRFWPLENPLGKRFKEVLQGMDGAWMTVIGVVGDASMNRDGSADPTFYWSVRQWSLSPVELVIRTDHDPGRLALGVRKAIRSADPELPYFEVSTVEQQLRYLDHPRKFQAELIGIFAAIALVLAAAGLYALMSYSVQQRTQEIGIRMALGAKPGDVRNAVVLGGMGLALIGITIGIVSAFELTRVLAGSLFGVEARDPITFVAVPVLLSVVALLAVWIPARRATQINPVDALRWE